MSTVAIVQARMSSTRLPGKALADVCGRPLLSLLLARLARARTLDRIVVATSDQASDDPIAAVARTCGAEVFRGPLDDVLGRFVGALHDDDRIVVRITADCPLIDAQIVDDVVESLRASPGASYASNVEPRTFPDGLDVEAVPTSVLRELDASIDDPTLREHVTLLVRREPDRWPHVAIGHRPDLGLLRWTVDTADDLAFVRSVVARLGTHADSAGLDEILAAVRAEPNLSEDGLRG